MRFAFVGLALVPVAVVFFLACGENQDREPFTGDGSDNVSDGGTSGNVADACDDALRAPNCGCLLVSTGYRSGARAENLPRTDITGAVNWTNPAGAQSEDGQFASVTLDDGQESAELRVSDFGIQIPDEKEPWGIEVELKRRAPDGGVEDSKIDVHIEGEGTRWKYLKGPWPSSIVGTHVYGQPADTWGVNLKPHHANKSDFAAYLWVKKAPEAGAPGPVTALVDSLKVAVYHCK